MIGLRLIGGRRENSCHSADDYVPDHIYTVIHTEEEMKKEIMKALLGNGNNDDFIIGEAVYIRTITYHQTGRVIGLTKSFVVLEDAAWIPDSGRFMQAIETGTLDEVEPVTVPVRVSLACIVDVYPWLHNLPRSQK
jgi:hypothetical protein